MIVRSRAIVSMNNSMNLHSAVPWRYQRAYIVPLYTSRLGGFAAVALPPMPPMTQAREGGARKKKKTSSLLTSRNVRHVPKGALVAAHYSGGGFVQHVFVSFDSRSKILSLGHFDETFIGAGIPPRLRHFQYRAKSKSWIDPTTGVQAKLYRTFDH